MGNANFPPVDRHTTKLVNQLVIDSIITDGRSFSDFSKTGINALIQTIIPGIKINCRQTIAKKIKMEFSNYKNKLISSIASLSSIALTTDLWRNRNLTHFLCLTAHFFDKNFKYFSIVIAFRKFSTRHTAVNLEEFIRTELGLLEIPIEKVISITSDNGSDIKKAASSLTTRFSCFAHNLNLIVKNSLGLWKPNKY